MKRTIVLPVLFLTACGGGAGTIDVNIYGEDFIEKEIPAAAGPEDEGLVDGYSVTYNKFVIAIGGIEIANREGLVAAADEGLRIWDVAKEGPHSVAEFTVDSGRWDRVSIEMKRASVAVAGNADEADVTAMNQGGFSLIAAGRATTGTTTYTFDWHFTTETLFSNCVDADDKEGVNVPTGGRAPMQITIHGDHLFYDDLQSEDPKLRFAPLAAADANGDFDVTLDELAAVDLTTLPSDQYGTGGDPSVNDLGAFVTDLTRTLVHFQGEGHCEQTKQ